jgi:hypothetical protein
MVGCAASVLTGCTGGSDPKPAASSTAPAVTGSGKGEVPGGFDGLTPKAVATVDGTVKKSGGAPVAARAEIEVVQASADSTVLRWRLSVPSGEVKLSNKDWGIRALGNIDRVALVATGEDLQLNPVTWKAPKGTLRDCGCSKVPYGVGPKGAELGALYSALPASVTEVEVRIPGFAAVKVPVTRA